MLEYEMNVYVDCEALAMERLLHRILIISKLSGTLLKLALTLSRNRDRLPKANIIVLFVILRLT